jgi:hypothetical protein
MACYEKPELWYILSEEELKDVKKTLKNRFKARYDVLESLSLTDDTFLDKFTSYFSNNNAKLCKDLTEGNTVVFQIKHIGGGKVGKVYSLESAINPRFSVIMKSITGSEPPDYLSTRLINIEPGHTVMTPSFKYWTIRNQKNKKFGVTVMVKQGFTNQTILHLLLNHILQDEIGYIHQYDAFWCDGSGYNITEWAMGGDMHNYFTTTDYFDVMNAIHQVLVPISILKEDKFSFLHADLKARNIFVDVSTNPPTYKIADYDKSSITWNGYRFYNAEGYLASARLDDSPVKVVNGWYSPIATIALQVYTMHSPFGYFMSYDIYTFFISLLAIPSIWLEFMGAYELKTSNKFFDIFKRLWKEDQFGMLINHLKTDDNWKRMESISNINNTITNLELSLLYDIDFVYKYFDVQPPVLNQLGETLNITSSKTKRLCLTPCKKTCKTPKYSKIEMTMGPYWLPQANKVVYDQDDC